MTADEIRKFNINLEQYGNPESAHDAGTDEEVIAYRARQIWRRFVGIPITEPYTAEFQWLLDLLSGNEAPKKTLTEAVQEARGNLEPPTVPIRFAAPASHAAESAPVSTAPECCPHKDEDHVLTAYRRYCKYCSCETKECSCKSWRGINTDCPMHGEGRLKAQDEPTLAEKVHAVMTAGVKDVGVDHFYGKSPVAQLDAEDPAEPVEDVVGEMLDVWFDEDMPENQDDRRKCMTRSLAVARKGYVKLEDVEKAIREVCNGTWCGSADFIAKIKGRLAPKPSPDPIEEVIATAICNECGARVGKRELHLKWHAALFPKTGGAK